ncbi:hypothetical protein WJX74_006883 [Apatococcus lobatus]|uniref:Uncharacterized protein n=1 Tax=Apatococcus lobatus TaxID=904363 RepID=A0AAW1RPP6_9CHLO
MRHLNSRTACGLLAAAAFVVALVNPGGAQEPGASDAFCDCSAGCSAAIKSETFEQVAYPQLSSCSPSASLCPDQPEPDREGECSSGLRTGCLSQILGHMTVEDLQSVFKSQGVDSAAWQELLSLQLDAQLEVRLVLDSSDLADPTPHKLRFPLSAILPDGRTLQQQPASEASRLAKLAEPILSWLNAQPEATTADSIEMVAQQAGPDLYDIWDDEADPARAWRQWQDARHCTEQQQLSCQPSADTDVGLFCSPYIDSPAACTTHEQPCLAWTDDAEEEAYMSSSAHLPPASPQQQLSAATCSTYDTAAAAAPAAPEYNWWHPDTDLAALQHRLQHVQSGRSMDVWLGICTVAAGTAWWGYQCVQRFVSQPVRPRLIAPLPKHVSVGPEAPRAGKKCNSSKPRRRSFSSSIRRGMQDGPGESNARSSCSISSDQKAAANSLRQIARLQNSPAGESSSQQRLSSLQASAADVHARKASQKPAQAESERAECLLQTPSSCASAAAIVSKAKPAAKRALLLQPGCKQVVKSHKPGTPVDCAQSSVKRHQAWPSSPTSPLELAGGDSGSDTSSTSGRTRLKDVPGPLDSTSAVGWSQPPAATGPRKAPTVSIDVIIPPPPPPPRRSQPGSQVPLAAAMLALAPASSSPSTSVESAGSLPELPEDLCSPPAAASSKWQSAGPLFSWDPASPALGRNIWRNGPGQIPFGNWGNEDASCSLPPRRGSH